MMPETRELSKIQFEICQKENGTNGVKILERRSILIGRRIHYFLRTQRVSRLLLKLKSVY